ncbi:hypothetical protein CJ030_MR1G007959 [Morella rubra]|uniref:Uncharacterized protein n=1 Tax=Morella rubra TaxID=262757 RepID=A0A6A1WSG1_9ROSI|nr:hypothetical protein CJ030_MR1G007959 [Morella rubra]
MPAPTPSTPASGDFETRASSQPTLAPSLEATSNSGRRGRTRGLALDKVRATRLDKLSVSIPDNCAADIGENSAKLSTQIGLLIRGTIPMATSSWNEVPTECKEYVRVRILDDFNLDYNREEDLRTVNMIMAKSYRQFKGRLHEYYKKKGGGNKEVAIRHPHPDMDEDTWAKLCDMFADPKYEKGLDDFPNSGYKDVCSISKSVGNFPSVTSEIGPAELYAASHKRKNGDWLSDVAKDNHAQLEIDRLKAEREAEIEQMRIEREAEMAHAS